MTTLYNTSKSDVNYVYRNHVNPLLLAINIILTIKTTLN